MNTIMNLKSEDGSYKNHAFQKIGNTSFNFMASNRCPTVTIDLILYYMYALPHVTPKSFHLVQEIVASIETSK